MPFSRSNTIKKPKSQASPLTPNLSTPKPSVPTPHYASASGHNTKSPSRGRTKQGEASENRRSRSGQRTSKYTQFYDAPNVPSPLELSSSESSFDKATFEYYPPLKSLPTSKYPVTRSALPEMETHLLPSLRDTVDRMTQAGQPSPYAGMGDFSRSGSNKSARRSSPESKNAVKISAAFAAEERFLKSQESLVVSPQVFDDTRSPKIHRAISNNVTPTLENLAPRFKSPAKSALKSSIRSPGLNSGSPKTAGIASSPSMAGSSLKTMKSLLSRKCSQTLKSPFGNSKVDREVDRRTSTDSRMSPSGRKSLLTTTEGPQSAIVSEYLDRMSSTKKTFQSNIPRPRTRYYHDDPSQINIDDSDFDRRYENELRERRKLTVANAEVSVSGSSSGSDAESRRNWETETPADFRTTGKGMGYQSHTSVGLGLSFQREEAISRSEENNDDIWKGPNSKFRDVRPITPEKNLRFSLPPSESAMSSYSDELSDFQNEANRREYDDCSARRIHNERPMTMRSPLATPSVHDPSVVPSSRNRIRSSRSPTRKVESTDDEIIESEREGYSVRRQRKKDRRRSSSCTPTSLPSPKCDSSTPAMPPRSRSACHHHSPRSSSRSPVYPPNLRDLIKKRNSFSKLSSMNGESLLSKHGIRTDENYKASGKQKYQTPHRYTPPSERHRGKSPRRSSYETTKSPSVADVHRSAAARERLAFGIPPSESDDVPDGIHQAESLSSTESQMSSLNASLWKEDIQDLSESAESIFRAVENPKISSNAREFDGQQYIRTPRLSVISPTLSDSSASAEFAQEKKADLVESTAHPLPSHNSLGGLDGAAQNVSRSREAVIQEIFETEEELLRRFHICIRAFVLPLRVHSTQAWIAGVPASIARLLDWFDDIVKLHEQIYDSLCSARDTMSPATDRVSQFLKCFVLKAEVYQPYLVRLADVSQEIVCHLRNPASDFGQFVALQQDSQDCEGWSFEKLLMLPVRRLAEYQDLFARMLDSTPKTHQDYLSTFSLSRSTDMVIRVMTEVKIREDEYNLLKVFSSRVQGLPPSICLATRERRLLHSGPLNLVLGDNSKSVESSNQSCGSWQKSDSKRISRASKLLDAVSTANLNFILERSETDSRRPGPSTSASSTAPTSVKSSWFSRLPLRKKVSSKSPLPPEDSGESQTDILRRPLMSLNAIAVHAFVFTDLVLLAHSCQVEGDRIDWSLCQDLGIFNPLSIARIQNSHPGTILSLEALIPNGDVQNDDTEFKYSAFRTIDLVLPLLSHQISGNDREDAEIVELLQPWLLALRQCARTTLRKLTFAGHGRSDDVFLGSDRQFDTRAAVSSLVGSGLPIPRSPSGQFPDSYQEKDGVLSGEERQERGWWSLRYQQVFREFQRQDSLLDDDDGM